MLTDFRMIDNHVETFQLESDPGYAGEPYTMHMELLAGTSCETNKDSGLLLGILSLTIQISALSDDGDKYAELHIKSNTAFADESAVDSNDMEHKVRNNGISMFIPIIRGMIIAACAALSCPFNVAFPEIDISTIKWTENAPK